MFDPTIKRNCNTPGSCPYMAYGATGWACTYKEYCDHQLPRDSRLQPFYPIPSFPVIENETLTCQYCHLPISQCQGHTICKGDSNAKN
jgi:hypothetical protein